MIDKYTYRYVMVHTTPLDTYKTKGNYIETKRAISKILTRLDKWVKTVNWRDPQKQKWQLFNMALGIKSTISKLEGASGYSFELKAVKLKSTLIDR